MQHGIKDFRTLLILNLCVGQLTFLCYLNYNLPDLAKNAF